MLVLEVEAILENLWEEGDVSLHPLFFFFLDQLLLSARDALVVKPRFLFS